VFYTKDTQMWSLCGVRRRRNTSLYPLHPHTYRLLPVGVKSSLTGILVQVCGVWWESAVIWTQQHTVAPGEKSTDRSITAHLLSRRMYTPELVIMTSTTSPSISLQQNTYTHTHVLTSWFMSLRAWKWEAVPSSPRHVDQSTSYQKTTGRRAALQLKH